MADNKIKVDYGKFYQDTMKPFIEGPEGVQYLEPSCGLDFRYGINRPIIHENSKTCAVCPLLKKAYKHLEEIMDHESFNELKSYVDKARLFDLNYEERHNVESQDRTLICARYMIFYTMHEIERQKQFYWDKIKFDCTDEEINYE